MRGNTFSLFHFQFRHISWILCSLSLGLLSLSAGKTFSTRPMNRTPALTWNAAPHLLETGSLKGRLVNNYGSVFYGNNSWFCCKLCRPACSRGWCSLKRCLAIGFPATSSVCEQRRLTGFRGDRGTSGPSLRTTFISAEVQVSRQLCSFCLSHCLCCYVVSLCEF